MEGCEEYKHNIKANYDDAFWESTIVTDFDLVCSYDYIPVMTKMFFFSGFAVGTIVSGIVSDILGRKKSILIFSIFLFIM